MTPVPQSAPGDLAAIVGEAGVVTEPGAGAKMAVNGIAPGFVVYPPAADAVASVLKYASDHDLAVIPRGNGTKLTIGNPPRRYDISLSLQRLNQVRYYEAADLVLSVEPGMTLGELERFLAPDKLWLPLDPPGGGRSSLGGILAANASGPLRNFYGGPRDMVLGLKIATTEGKVIKTGGRVVKNVAGYDLAKLLIGSYGTLGVIVEASFKLSPVVAESETFVLAVGTLDKAREIRRRLQDSPLQPLRAVLLDANFMGYLRESQNLAEWDGGCQLWIEGGGSKSVMERYARELEALARQAGVPFRKAPSNAATENVWRRISDYSVNLAGQGWTLKASLPISAVEEYIQRAHDEVRPPDRALTCWASPCVGVVHVWLRPSPLLPALEPLLPRLRDLALDLGGALVIESAPSESKGCVDAWGPAGDDFEITRELKSAWDPKGILSPGRFVAGL